MDIKKDINKEVLEAIAQVRFELNELRIAGTKAEQLECFNRLINLYSSLNASVGENETVLELKKAA